MGEDPVSKPIDVKEFGPTIESYLGGVT